MAGPPAAGKRQDTSRGKPNRIVEVPPESQRRVFPNEREHLVQNVKSSTGCDVVPRWFKDQGSESAIYRFEIFGSGPGVDRATRLLNNWVTHSHDRSEKSNAWAKLNGYDPDRWYYDEVERLDDEWRQQFKGPIPEPQEGDSALPKVTVPWPEELSSIDITPRSVFGNKLENLNEIRMRDRVWINLLPVMKDTWTIEIRGFDNKTVQEAEQHFYTLMSRVHTETIGTQDKLNMILDETEGQEIILERADQWWPDQNDFIVPRLLPSPKTDESRDFRQRELHFEKLSAIQHSVELALEHIRHQKGSYDFAVRMGCIALSRKQFREEQIGETYSKEVFKQATKTQAEIIRNEWIFQDMPGKRLLQKLVDAEDLLEPTRNADSWWAPPDSLKDVEPTYRGTWTFRDPSSNTQALAHPRFPGRVIPPQQNTLAGISDSSTRLIVVQVDWIKNGEGLFEKTNKSFYKLSAGRARPKTNMDINLMELGVSKSWYFSLESKEKLIPKTVSPILTGFADRVAMKPEYNASSSEPFAQWDPTPVVKSYLQDGRLDKIYTFGVQNTGYQVEAKAMWHPGRQVPCWGLSLRHSEWAIHLAELERLRVGSQATWGHVVSTFLPNDGISSSGTDVKEDLGMKYLNIGLDQPEPVRNGIRVLMDTVLELSKIVSTVGS